MACGSQRCIYPIIYPTPLDRDRDGEYFILDGSQVCANTVFEFMIHVLVVQVKFKPLILHTAIIYKWRICVPANHWKGNCNKHIAGDLIKIIYGKGKLVPYDSDIHSGVCLC